MNKPVPIGSIGAYTLEDSQRLYRLENEAGGLYYLRSLEAPLRFVTCLPWHFWPLVDSL